MKKSEFIKSSVLTGITCITCAVTTNSNAAIVINEFDYDQPGTDSAEFIELYNGGSSTTSLDNYTIKLINGNNSTAYRNIDLSGFSISASGYFVVCGDASLVANCDYSFTASGSWIQNGSPDAIALYQENDLLDSISYEGSLGLFTEGDAFAPEDNNNDILSIGRTLDGIDTNNNALDFQLGCITPGSANIAGMGDCSSTGVSAVPVPAAAWLLASGLIGLIGFSRRS